MTSSPERLHCQQLMKEAGRHPVDVSTLSAKGASALYAARKNFPDIRERGRRIFPLRQPLKQKPGCLLPAKQAQKALPDRFLRLLLRGLGGGLRPQYRNFLRQKHKLQGANLVARIRKGAKRLPLHT